MTQYLDRLGNPIAKMGNRVLYTISQEDADAITQRRVDWEAWRNANNGPDNPYVHFKGNDVSAGGIYPAIVAANNGDGSVNLRVLLDAEDLYWAQNVSLGADSNQQGSYVWQSGMQ